MKRISLFSILFFILFCFSHRSSFAEGLPSIEKAVCPQLRNPVMAAKYISEHEEEIKNVDNQTLKTLSPIDAFKYLSGNTNPLNNLPAIFAHGSKEERKVTVVGCGFYKEFPLENFDDAVNAYKELLMLNRYLK